MNLKKMWKRFWTMNVHNHEGFTLVELIIVIAILAILSSVAVVGYSSYVTKANKQADQTMIAEIKNALQLAGYGGTFAEGEGGYIVLSTDGVANGDAIAEDSALDLAMDAAYGDNWRETLKLKYNAWGNNGLFGSLSPYFANAVVNSSYLNGTRADKLLTDVEIMTGMANNLVEALNVGSAGTTLSKVFTRPDGTSVLDETAAKYGITKDQNETWEQWAAKSPENNTAYGNLLVMAAADETDALMNGTVDSSEISGGSQVIISFSSYYAFAAQDEEFSAVLDKYMDHLNGNPQIDVDGDGDIDNDDLVTDSESGKAWYLSLQNAAGPDYNAYHGTEQYNTDGLAFMSIMAGIGNPSSDQASQVGADLSNPNLFTQGVVNGMYNDFLAGAEAVAGTYNPNGGESNGTQIDLSNGNVAILVVMKAGNLTVVDSIP